MLHAITHVSCHCGSSKFGSTTAFACMMHPCLYVIIAIIVCLEAVLGVGVGGTPVRQAFKEGNFAHRTATKHEKGKQHASKLSLGIADDGSKKRRLTTAGSNQFYCLFCADIYYCHNKKNVSTHGSKAFKDLVGATEGMSAWVHQRFGHRSKTVCKHCVPKLEQALVDFNAEEWTQEQKDVLRILEAFGGCI